MAKFKLLEKTKGVYQFMCPGCKEIHQVWTDKEDKVSPWDFNGDINKPTISPSILVQWSCGNKKFKCHSYIKNGEIQYLSDCTHELAGQIIELPEIE